MQNSYMTQEFLLELFRSFPSWALPFSIGLSILVLGFAADKMVDGAASLAAYTGLSPLIIGATIISLGTTMPEMVVSVMAAFYGDSSLALGNGIGSIIADTALIMGLLILFGKILIDREGISQTSWWRDLSATGLVIAALLLPEQILPRWFGFVLLGLLVLYLLQMYHTKGKSRQKGEPENARHPDLSLLQSIIYLLIGLIFVVGSSHILLPQVELFAVRLNVSEDIIATTLVAFGTSLPELTTALTAIRKKEEALGIGNVMGADILNALFVIGAASATKPIQIDTAFFGLHFPVMLLVLWTLRLLFLAQMRGKYWAIPKWYGLMLIVVYICYVAMQYIGE